MQYFFMPFKNQCDITIFFAWLIGWRFVSSNNVHVCVCVLKTISVNKECTKSDFFWFLNVNQLFDVRSKALNVIGKLMKDFENSNIIFYQSL